MLALHQLWTQMCSNKTTLVAVSQTDDQILQTEEIYKDGVCWNDKHI